MEMTSREWLILANGFVCLMGSAISFCRCGVMEGPDTKSVFRVMYGIYFLAYVLSMFSYIWGDLPTWTSIAFEGALVLVLLFSFNAWRNGPPAYTYKRIASLMREFQAIATGQHQPIGTDARHE